MNSIKMNRKELLAIVNKNWDKHIADYAESVSDYNAAMKLVAADNIKIAKANAKLLDANCEVSQLKGFKSYITAPISYTKEYSRAARMLELSVEDIIEIEEDVFNQLVLDEWGWKNQFVQASTMYKRMSGSL